MKLIYVIAADVLRALGWEVKINEKENYWNLVLTNTNSSEDMPQSHKSCLRGLLRGWLMEFNYEGGHQQVNIYKELHGLSPEDDRYSCLDTCVKRVDGDTPEHELDDREIFVRRKDRFDRYVLTDPVAEDITTKLTNDTKVPFDTISKQCETIERLMGEMVKAAEDMERVKNERDSYYQQPEDGRDKHLYRIKNKIGDFYIVARSFDEAADEMKKRLDKADYGFFRDRNVPSIDDLAVEEFFNDKQLFSDSEANLIIVEG